MRSSLLAALEHIELRLTSLQAPASKETAEIEGTILLAIEGRHTSSFLLQLQLLLAVDAWQEPNSTLSRQRVKRLCS